MTLVLERSRDDVEVVEEHPFIAQDRWQYRLTQAPHPGAMQVGDFWLSVGAGLPVTQVRDHAGAPVGLLLGHPIDLACQVMIEQSWTVPAGVDLASEDGVHRTLRALGGHYIWICLTPTFARIYPDAITQVTCVWDTTTQSAGATAHAILSPSAYQDRFDQSLFTKLGVIGEGWFPAGLTAHRAIHRLLPNHYLDLKSWQAHRTQVVTRPPSPCAPSDIVTTIAHLVKQQINALFRGPEPVVIALTAGRDSRAVLACARQWADQVVTVTVTGEDRHQIDTIVAKAITKTLGIRHKTLPRQVADQPAQSLFLRRGGHCHGDSNTAYHPSITPLVDHCVFVGGLGGEIARSVYRRVGDHSGMILTPALILGRLGLPRVEQAEAAIQTWLDNLPANTDAFATLDLVYLELRQGPWGTAQFCADPTLVRHAPLMSYDSVSLMLTLPDDWKTNGRLNEAIVADCWPELAEFPYNTAGWLQDVRTKFQRVFDDPSLIAKHFRKRFA